MWDGGKKPDLPKNNSNKPPGDQFGGRTSLISGTQGSTGGNQWFKESVNTGVMKEREIGLKHVKGTYKETNLGEKSKAVGGASKSARWVCYFLCLSRWAGLNIQLEWILGAHGPVVPERVFTSSRREGCLGGGGGVCNSEDLRCVEQNMSQPLCGPSPAEVD